MRKLAIFCIPVIFAGCGLAAQVRDAAEVGLKEVEEFWKKVARPEMENFADDLLIKAKQTAKDLATEAKEAAVDKAKSMLAALKSKVEKKVSDLAAKAERGEPLSTTEMLFLFLACILGVDGGKLSLRKIIAWRRRRKLRRP